MLDCVLQSGGIALHNVQAGHNEGMFRSLAMCSWMLQLSYLLPLFLWTLVDRVSGGRCLGQHWCLSGRRRGKSYGSSSVLRNAGGRQGRWHSIPPTQGRPCQVDHLPERHGSVLLHWGLPHSRHPHALHPQGSRHSSSGGSVCRLRFLPAAVALATATGSLEVTESNSSPVVLAKEVVHGFLDFGLLQGGATL